MLQGTLQPWAGTPRGAVVAGLWAPRSRLPPNPPCPPQPPLRRFLEDAPYPGEGHGTRCYKMCGHFKFNIALGTVIVRWLYSESKLHYKCVLKLSSQMFCAVRVSCLPQRQITSWANNITFALVGRVGDICCDFVVVWLVYIINYFFLFWYDTTVLTWLCLSCNVIAQCTRCKDLNGKNIPSSPCVTNRLCLLYK